MLCALKPITSSTRVCDFWYFAYFECIGLGIIASVVHESGRLHELRDMHCQRIFCFVCCLHLA